MTTVYADRANRVRGVAFVRPDGSVEEVGCSALVLACSGFGGNAAMVRHHIPEIADALYFGHAGNQGDAVAWGTALGAAVRDMTAYQGHGSVATPHGVLITWALMMEGGFQVNSQGRRFSNEHLGYSEQCVPGDRAARAASPGTSTTSGSTGSAWNSRTTAAPTDWARFAAPGRSRDSRRACGLPDRGARGDVRRGLALRRRRSAGSLRSRFHRQAGARAALLRGEGDRRALSHPGRTGRGRAGARPRRRQGAPLPNLFAGGGAACGVSGARVWGYLSGNGLLAAVTLGRLAGISAAAMASRTKPA